MLRRFKRTSMRCVMALGVLAVTTWGGVSPSGANMMPPPPVLERVGEVPDSIVAWFTVFAEAMARGDHKAAEVACIPRRYGVSSDISFRGLVDEAHTKGYRLVADLHHVYVASTRAAYAVRASLRDRDGAEVRETYVVFVKERHKGDTGGWGAWALVPMSSRFPYWVAYPYGLPGKGERLR